MRAPAVLVFAGVIASGCVAVLELEDADYGRTVALDGSVESGDVSPDAGTNVDAGNVGSADAATDSRACLADGEGPCPTSPCCGSLACNVTGRCAPTCSRPLSGCSGGAFCCFGLTCDTLNNYCCVPSGGECGDASDSVCCTLGAHCVGGYCQ